MTYSIKVKGAKETHKVTGVAALHAKLSELKAAGHIVADLSRVA